MPAPYSRHRRRNGGIGDPGHRGEHDGWIDGGGRCGASPPILELGGVDVLEANLTSATSLPSSSRVTATCHSCWVRPRWIGVAEPISTPSVVARMKSV